YREHLCRALGPFPDPVAEPINVCFIGLRSASGLLCFAHGSFLYPLPAYAFSSFFVRSSSPIHVTVATERRLKTLLSERNPHRKNRTDNIAAARTMKISTTG